MKKGGKSWTWFRVGFNFQYYLVVHYNVAEIQKKITEKVKNYASRTGRQKHYSVGWYTKNTKQKKKKTKPESVHCWCNPILWTIVNLNIFLANIKNLLVSLFYNLLTFLSEIVEIKFTNFWREILNLKR